MMAMKEQLRKALEALTEVRDNEITDIAATFERIKLESIGMWVGVRLDPLTGEWSTTHDASRTVSCDEYFNESGPLSEMTICGGQANESPSPDHGYEWIDSVDGEYVRDEGSNWCPYERVIEQFGEEDDEGADVDMVIVRENLTRFTVGTTPTGLRRSKPRWRKRSSPVRDGEGRDQLIPRGHAPRRPRNSWGRFFYFLGHRLRDPSWQFNRVNRDRRFVPKVMPFEYRPRVG